MIYCFGDSLTQGVPGTAYSKFLTKEKRHINLGLGGDTLIGITAGAEKRWMGRIKPEDTVILGAGTNDFLMPYYLTLPKQWQIAYEVAMKAGMIPCSSEGDYFDRFYQLLEQFYERTRNIIVFGLPFVECTENDFNERFCSYNIRLSEICGQFGLPFVDIQRKQAEIKASSPAKGSYFNITADKSEKNVVHDAAITRFPMLEKSLCKKRNLAVTVDGLHFNRLSAKTLAAMFNELLVAEDGVKA